MRLSESRQLVVEPVETTSDYKSDIHFYRCYNEFIELLSVTINSDFSDSLILK